MQLDEVDKDGEQKQITEASSSNVDSVALGKVEPPKYIPELLDEKYRTSRLEIYAYYAYYVGNNGLSLFSQ